MARQSAPENLKNLYSLRIANIPEDLKNEDLLDDLKSFGSIGDFYRPTNLYRQKPSPYAFVRYFTQEDANNCKACMQGKQYGDRLVSVFDANKQNSYFTQDTGFITNEAFDTPKVQNTYFDSSMPDAHYEMKRRLELQTQTDVYTVRVDDIPSEIRKEQLEKLFGQYGDIASIYFPTDLHSVKTRGFAFIRFLQRESAIDAVRNLNGCVLLPDSRCITVTLVENKQSYFSQDESPLEEPKKKGQGIRV